MHAEDVKGRIKERVARIHKHVPILEVLARYGYTIHEDAEGREQQFSCDLHGDGQDGKPSARVYPASASWYCFGCSLSRDAIKTVQEKEGLSFSQACYKIEERFNLPHPANWNTGDWDQGERSEENPGDVIRIDETTTFESEERQTGNLLLYLTRERILERKVCLLLWELYDRAVWSVHKEVWSESRGKEAVAKLRAKAIALGAKALQEAS